MIRVRVPTRISSRAMSRQSVMVGTIESIGSSIHSESQASQAHSYRVAFTDREPSDVLQPSTPVLRLSDELTAAQRESVPGRVGQPAQGRRNRDPGTVYAGASVKCQHHCLRGSAMQPIAEPRSGACVVFGPGPRSMRRWRLGQGRSPIERRADRGRNRYQSLKAWRSPPEASDPNPRPGSRHPSSGAGSSRSAPCAGRPKLRLAWSSEEEWHEHGTTQLAA